MEVEGCIDLSAKVAGYFPDGKIQSTASPFRRSEFSFSSHSSSLRQSPQTTHVSILTTFNHVYVSCHVFLVTFIRFITFHRNKSGSPDSSFRRLVSVRLAPPSTLKSVVTAPRYYLYLLYKHRFHLLDVDYLLNIDYNC